tara:strand:+ start:15263 stop:16306 length:1044 start_codon:yes stop_codon:yes gene_type:complete
MLISEQALYQIIREEVLALIQEIGRRDFLKGLAATGATAAAGSAMAHDKHGDFDDITSSAEALKHVQHMYSISDGKPNHRRFGNLIKLINKKFGSADASGLSKFIVSGFEKVPVFNTRFTAQQVTQEFQRTGHKPFAQPQAIARALAKDRSTSGALRRFNNSYFLTVSNKTSLSTYVHEYLHYLDDVLYPAYIRMHHGQQSGPMSDGYAQDIKNITFPRKIAEYRIFASAAWRTTDFNAALQKYGKGNPRFKEALEKRIQEKAFGDMTMYEYLMSPGEFRSFIWELFPDTPKSEEDVIKVIQRGLQSQSKMQRAFAALLDPKKSAAIFSFLAQLANNSTKQPGQQTA